MALDLRPFDIQTERLRLSGFCANEHLGNPVIALHGWLDNAASFQPLAQYLSADRAFYALELPGHGQSEHRPDSVSYHLMENVVDVVAFIDHIFTASQSPTGGKSKKVTLVGHSLGGIICSFLAASAPELVERLILLDSMGPLTDEIENVLPQLRKAIKKARMLSAGKMTVYPTFEKAVQTRCLGIGRVSVEASTLLCRRGLKAVEGGYVWSSDSKLLAPSFLRLSEEQVAAILSGIECPVNLICGREGYFSAYQALEKRLSYFKIIRRDEVEGGHHFHMDGDVEGAARIINKLL